MTAYYNEIDPYAAQWLRNLIDGGHIARGDVDERSIIDVRADDLRGYTQCHFFAGIGGWSIALRLAGWDDDSLFGQVHAPASPSQPPERARRPMTAVTCGLRGFLSSESGALQSSMESRLRRRLDGAGSMLFSLTWKAKATPAGRPYCQLAASGRPISDSACGSWPTPEAAGFGGDVNIQNTLARRARYQEKYGNNGFGLTLAQTAALAPWPTPMAGTPAQKGYNEAGNTDSGRKTVALASWATPNAGDDRGASPGWQAAKDRHAANGVNKQMGLRDQVLLANWATPRAEDSESSGMRHSRGVADTLTAQASLTASGATPNGSTAQTEKPGQLDPDHSRWVMGYSAEHLSCAPTETPSFLKSRRNSSVPA